MKYDVFISYSRADINKIKNLVNDIETSTNTKCWMDIKGIDSGNPEFARDIIDAINSCPIFLFMLSKESQQSDNALKELAFAYKKHHEIGKKVVIVYIESCKMNDLLSFNYQMADTIDWHNKEQREKLIRNIQEWTGYDQRTELVNKISQLSEEIKVLESKNESLGNEIADIEKSLSRLKKQKHDVEIALIRKNKQLKEVYHPDIKDDRLSVSDWWLIVTFGIAFGIIACFVAILIMLINSVRAMKGKKPLVKNKLLLYIIAFSVIEYTILVSCMFYFGQ